MNGRLENELKITQRTKNLLASLPEYMTDFYYLLQSSSTPTTLYEYIVKSKGFIDFIGKDIKDVTTTDVGRFIEKIKHTNKNGNVKKTSYSYQKTYWFILNRLFDFLESNGAINKNPMSSKTIINQMKPARAKDDVIRPVIDMDDLNSILAAVKTGVGNQRARSFQKAWKERDLLVIFLLMTTGMRRTALSEINIEDIDFEERIINVIDKRATPQKYYITEELEKTIKQWLKRREVLLGDIKCDALFISNNRQRMSSKSIENLVKKYSLEGIGYKISPHKLRSAFITNYYEESGHDPEATRQAAGHSDISTTMRYVAGKNNSRVEAMNFMSKNLKI